MYSRLIVHASRWCSLALPLFASATPALGDEQNGRGALPVIVDYQAPAECPTASRFRQELASRLSLPLSAPPTRSAQGTILEQTTVHVRISRTPQKTYIADLVTKTSAGASSPRNLTGPNCAALTEALAFTAALALDPEGRHSTVPGQAGTSEGQGDPDQRSGIEPDATEQQPADQPGVPRETGVADSTSPAPPGVTREGSAPDEQGSGSTPSSMEYVWDTPQETSPPGYWTSALGAGVSLASPLTTGFDTGVYAQFSTFRKARSGAGMWTWSPALALAVHVLRSPWTGKGQVASFYQTSVQASVCPHRVADGNFAWKLCATGQYGSLFAYGEHLTNPRRTRTPVASAGASLWLEYAVGAHLTLTGHAGALVELSQHVFEIGEDPMLVGETRVISPWLGFGVSTPL